MGDFGPQDIKNANTRAIVLKNEGNYDGARDYLHHALIAARRYIGDDHPDTISVMFNLSSLLQLTGKAEEATPLVYEVLKARRSDLGDDHPDTVNAMVNLGSLLENEGKFDEALEQRRAVVAARRKMDDGKDVQLDVGEFAEVKTGADKKKELLASLDSLGLTLVKKGDLEGALPVLTEEIDGHVAMLGAGCVAQLPPETTSTGRQVSEKIGELQKEGKSVAGYAE